MDSVFLDPEKSGRIKQYWSDRARSTDPTSAQATTYDVFLRDLEIATLKDRIAAACLPANSRILDLGCGDGYATVALAGALPTLRFLGVDWSEDMLALCKPRLSAHPDLGDRLSFRPGNMRQLSASLGDQKFEVCLTMRSLINLTTSDEQYDTLRQIAEHLVPGGYYFGIENFLQGQENFNRLRLAMGLPEIPVRWHNHFFDEGVFRAETAQYFDSLVIDNFSSSYYLATRIIYSAGCHLLGEEPDYFHPIHQTAGRLPAIGDFSPIKLVSMRRKL